MNYIEASKPNHLVAILLISPFFLALLIAALNFFRSSVSSFLIPTPTPLPNAPPEKVGPVNTTGFPDFSA